MSLLRVVIVVLFVTTNCDYGNSAGWGGFSGITVVSADGSSLRELTKSGKVYAFSPAWSPDGRKIAYVAQDREASPGDSDSDVFTMNADGSQKKRLTTTSGSDGQPAWSPDGQQIAFTSDRGGRSQVYVMQPDGSGQRLLVSLDGDAEWPVWSPDGSRIAYLLSAEQKERRFAPGYDPCLRSTSLYVTTANGSDTTSLVENISPCTHRGSSILPGQRVVWSPDGLNIAFAFRRDESTEVGVIGRDGSGLVNMSGNSANDIEPAWSPGGDEIAFASNRDGGFHIYLVKADGSELRHLTGGLAPAWSPDGSQIAFEWDGINVINVDGSNQVRVGLDNSERGPQWSPDGRRIIFTWHDYIYPP